MSMGFYGKEKRYVLRRPFSLVRSTGVPIDTAVGFHTEQETISFRNRAKGTPVLESEIDPYAGFLRRSAEKQIVRNRLVTPVRVGGKQIGYNPHVDNGHAFRTRKCTVNTSVSFASFYISATPSTFRHGGPLFAVSAKVNSANASRMPFLFQGSSGEERRAKKLPLPPVQSDLPSFGKRAIVELAPGFPDVSLFASVGELVSAFPQFMGKTLFDELSRPGSSSFIGATGALTRGAAGEFLNYLFGIAPTIADIAKIVEVFKTSSEKLLFLERNSGLGVRRNMSFTIPRNLQIFSSSELEDQGQVECIASGLYGPGLAWTNQGAVYATQRESSLTMQLRRKVTFSGSFTRFLPAAPGLPDAMGKFLSSWDSILGLKPTAATIWQLIPFSWLVDWFLEIQNSLALYDRVNDDSLVINYGYVMGMTERSSTQRTQLSYAPGLSASFNTISTQYTSVIKERVRANPFGFITPNEVEISPIRMAILAAIGVTGRSQN